MSHFFTIIIVPGSTQQEDVEAACERLLAPYDENMCVAPYKRYLESNEIDLMANHYQVSPQDLLALASHMDE